MGGLQFNRSARFKSAKLPIMLLYWLGCLCFLVQDISAQADDSYALQVKEADYQLQALNLSEARKGYRSVIRENKEYAPAHIGLAKVLVQERKWEEALSSIDKAYSIDNERLDAKYLKGIIHREIAKFDVVYAPRHRQQAIDLFSEISKADSTYETVFYQQSLLQRYLGNYSEAIQLGHRQLALHPENVETHIGLFRTYKYLIELVEEEEAKSVLQGAPESYRELFLAEMDRKAGRPNFATGRLDKLKSSSSLTLPLQPILLIRARLYYADRDALKAQQLVDQAINEIDSDVAAAYVFEDFKYILEDAELIQYKRLTSFEEKKAFFKALLEKRDPMPGRLENVRVTTHYNRMLVAEKEHLYYGIRSWHNNPDKAGYLNFPQVTFLNEEFNDKGLVYIRNGNPLDKITHVGGPDNFFRTQIFGIETSNWMPSERLYSTGYSLNESWRYSDPDIDFHFVVADNEENNWRLIPLLTSVAMLESREHWGDPYASMLRAIRNQSQASTETIDNFAFNAELEDGNTEFSDLEEEATSVGNAGTIGQAQRFELEIEETRQLMIEKSQESVELGLALDKHTWEDEIESMPIPYIVVSFRGDSDKGTTELDMYYALPMGKISEAWEGEKQEKIPVETGYAVLDTNWQTIDGYSSIKELPYTTDETAAIIDFHRSEVLPDSYVVALHGVPENASLMGGYKFGYTVPDYSGNELMMSDLLLAHRIEPDLRGTSRYTRNGYKIESNPFQRFSLNQIVYIYYEVYNLAYNSDDMSAYEIEYILTANKKNQKRRRKNRPILTLKVERISELRSPIEYAEFDVQQVDPGMYTMTIRITDMATGATTEKSQQFELTP